MQVDVCVVGGGLAGLFAAAELVAAGYDDIVVLEATSSPGGVAQTLRRDGFELEAATGSFQYPGPNLGRILDRAGVSTTPAISSSTRYVFNGDRLVPLRPGFELIRTSLLTLTSKIRILLEPLIHGNEPESDETLQSFCVRHFGTEAGSKAAWLAASGVFAGDPDRLSVEAAYPRLVALEQASGSLLMAAAKSQRSAPEPQPATHVPTDGIDGLAASLARSLGDRFISDFKVDRVEAVPNGMRLAGPQVVEAQRVVLALPPTALARLVDDDTADLLASIDHAPVVVAGIGGHQAEMALPPGFGALPVREAGLAIRGVLFESSYAPFRAPKGKALVKVIAGGATTSGLVDKDDEELSTIIIDELSRVLGRPVAPTFVELVRHVPGIPQLNIGHTALIETLESKLRSIGPISLAGWGYHGVGVAQLAADAARIRQDISGRTVAA